MTILLEDHAQFQTGGKIVRQFSHMSSETEYYILPLSMSVGPSQTQPIHTQAPTTEMASVA